MKKKRPSSCPTSLSSIRSHYEVWGVDQYYRTQGADYVNPHQNQVKALLKKTGAIDVSLVEKKQDDYE